jgi:Leucine-rich repeat (LRR) protein
MDETPKRSRRLGLSVRGLMLTVLLMGAGLGWVVRSAHTQRDAVAAITASDGSVTYDWQWSPGKGPIAKGQPWAPRWLVDRLGVDHFGSVVMVRLGSRTTDAVMAHVGRLSKLDGLSCSEMPKVTDAGVVHLRGLHRLEHLYLNRSGLTGACLVDIARLKSLKSLYLTHIPVGDADLNHLSGLVGLESLNLEGTRVGDAGLEALRSLTKLKSLRLDSTQVRGVGLSRLAGMSHLGSLSLAYGPDVSLSEIPALPALKELNLTRTPIDDASLGGIERLDSLQTLYLPRTKITDLGLERLLRLKNLKSLMLSQTEVSSAGAKAIASLPALTRIYLDGTGIDDEGVAALAKSPKLKSLGLANTKITDAGLDHLATLKGLDTLDIGQTGVTDAGLIRFRKDNPNLRIMNKVQGVGATARNTSAAARDAATRPTASAKSSQPEVGGP